MLGSAIAFGSHFWKVENRMRFRGAILGLMKRRKASKRSSDRRGIKRDRHTSPRCDRMIWIMDKAQLDTSMLKKREEGITLDAAGPSEDGPAEI